jgi:hypothetical protein
VDPSRRSLAAAPRTSAHAAVALAGAAGSQDSTFTTFGVFPVGQ